MNRFRNPSAHYGKKSGPALRRITVYSLSLALFLLLPIGAGAEWQCPMGPHCPCHTGWHYTAVNEMACGGDCCRVQPSPDLNWLAQMEPAQGREYVAASALPIVAWDPPLESQSGHSPIQPLNELWTPPLNPLAQTSILRV